MYDILDTTSTIVAPATATGGAVAVVRMCGKDAIAIAEAIFRSSNPHKRLAKAHGYTLHYGTINDGDRIIDDVIVALFRAPHSYTGDDSVEITAHGSQYIVSEILRLCIEQGARMATAGEFTRRAFLAGKMDLSRAEAVADMIASDSLWSHRVATTQMRGGYSEQLCALREELLKLCSLLELELDFSEEDVVFADRTTLRQILDDVGAKIDALRHSFMLGNALKDGVSVAIIGEPNVGKSTLLNALVGEDRAMVSDIAGTTRDTIEVTTTIDGIRFRFIDTAGLRNTADRLEQMGIERTRRASKQAHIIVHIASAERPEFEQIEHTSEQRYIRVINKIDSITSTEDLPTNNTLRISAKLGIGIDALRTELRSIIDTSALDAGSVVVSNMRHYDALSAAAAALSDARHDMERNIPTDLLSEDIRRILHHLGEITGEITNDDILRTIFSTFCIGK